MTTTKAVRELAEIVLDILHYGDSLHEKRYSETYDDLERRLYDILGTVDYEEE